MGFFICLIVGGAIGWLARFLLPARERGFARTVGLGMFGGLIGGFMLGPLLGGGNLFEAKFYPMVVMDALLGAVILLALLNMFRRRRDAKRMAADQSPPETGWR